MMIVALAGRRIDAPDAKEKRFPLKNVEKVKEKLKRFFTVNKPAALVCSGACGADLLALEVAGECDIHRTMILPFPPEVFKEKSVTDRPGNWGDVFEKVYWDINSNEEVVVLHYAEDDEDAYTKTNLGILNRAESLLQTMVSPHESHQQEIMALAVWDGKNRGSDDATVHFMQEAKNRNMTVEEINTIQ